MKYIEYEKALSRPRLEKYKIACRNDNNKALILYRYNIKLSQKFYGVLGVLEVVLRNAIDEHYSVRLNDQNWIVTQAQSGFLMDNKNDVLEKNVKALNVGRYTHDKLIASLSFGVWTFMFSRKCYKKSGKTILQIFPNKSKGLNQDDIYNDLDRIRLFRNRIAHHEPLCFDNTGAICVNDVQEVYNLIVQYVQFLGYNICEIFYGVETPISTIQKIRDLRTSS